VRITNPDSKMASEGRQKGDQGPASQGSRCRFWLRAVRVTGRPRR
jgi:hypothetical protein